MAVLKTRPIKASFSIMWLALGSFSTMLVSIGAAAILSRYLSKEVYATYKQILFVYTGLQVVFVAGIPGVYSFFLPKFPILGQAKYVVNKLNRILFVLGCIFSLFLFFSAEIIAQLLRNSDLKTYLKIFSIVPLLSLPAVGIQGLLISFDKARLFSLYNVFAKLTIFASTLFPLIIGKYDLHSILIGWIVGTGINLIIAMWLKMTPFQNIKIEKVRFSLSDIFGFSLPILLASLLGLFGRSAEQFFISRYYGLSVFAEYSNGYIPVPLVGIITASVSSVLLARVSRSFHSSDIVKIKAIWEMTLYKSMLLIYPILIFAFGYARDIIEFIYGENYTESSLYFRVSVVGSFVNIITMASIMYGMNLGKKYVKNIAVGVLFVWIFDTIVVNLALDPIWIAIGASGKEALVFSLNLRPVVRMLELRILDFFVFRKLFLPLCFVGASMIISIFCADYIGFSGLFHALIGFLFYITFIYLMDLRFKVGLFQMLKELKRT